MNRICVTLLCCLFVGVGALALARCDASQTPTDGSAADGPRDADGPGGASLLFPAVTPPGCSCSVGEKYGTPHSPALDEQADAVAVSPGGKVLIVASTLQVFLFKRDSTDALFKEQASKVTLSQRTWRFQFSPDGKYVAVVMERQVQIWSVEKALQDPKDATVLQIDSPGDGSAITADAAFLSLDLVAVAFYGKKSNDLIQIWSVGASSKQLLSLEAQAVQSLAAAPGGGYLIAGGREAGGDEPRAMFTVFQIGGDASGLTMNQKQEFFLPQKNTNVTTVAVSPDNSFIAVGTSPDLVAQRGAPKPPTSGEHGFVSVWPTTPLKPGGGVILRPDPKRPKAHNVSVRRLAFRDDGQILGTLGIGSPRNSALLRLWQRQKDAQDKKAPFALVDSIEVATPGRDMSFGAGCHHVFNVSIVTPYIQMRKGCQ